VLALIGSGNGAFGGMGIVARCCTTVIMSEEGRLSLSGPEVIETVRGVEEFDSRDRGLVWRVTGGKHRFLINEAQVLVADDMAAFAQAAAAALAAPTQATDPLLALEQAQSHLEARVERFGHCRDGLDVWAGLGIDAPARLPLLDTPSFLAAVADRSLP
jgi:malonate decarboxylase beta subunit